VTRSATKNNKNEAEPEEKEKIELNIGEINLDSILDKMEKPTKFMDTEGIKLKNIKNFELKLKGEKSKSEKCRLVYLWCKKMMQHWEEELE
jgi:predicted ATP-dependent Lon-type protease